METSPIVVEQIVSAPVAEVWQAIATKEQMKKWYFDLQEFKAEPGFKFSFSGGPEDGVQYLHECEVIEVSVNRKLCYSWRYKGYEGMSYVSFELEDRGEQTLVKLMHTGLDSFPQDNNDFAKANFEAGWKEIIGSSLPKYLEEKQHVA